MHLNFPCCLDLRVCTEEVYYTHHGLNVGLKACMFLPERTLCV